MYLLLTNAASIEQDEDEIKRFLPSMYPPDVYPRGPPPGLYPPPRGEMHRPSPHVDHQRSFIVGKGSRDPIYLNDQMAAEQGWEPRGMGMYDSSSFPVPSGVMISRPRSTSHQFSPSCAILTRFNKIVIQGTPPMVADKEAIVPMCYYFLIATLSMRTSMIWVQLISQPASLSIALYKCTIRSFPMLCGYNHPINLFTL